MKPQEIEDLSFKIIEQETGARAFSDDQWPIVRRSERFAMEKFKELGEEAFIQTGDFFKASFDMAVLQPEINTIIYTVFFGKAVKMALGFEHTHAVKSELTLKK